MVCNVECDDDLDVDDVDDDNEEIFKLYRCHSPAAKHPVWAGRGFGV